MVSAPNAHLIIILIPKINASSYLQTAYQPNLPEIASNAFKDLVFLEQIVCKAFLIVRQLYLMEFVGNASMAFMLIILENAHNFLQTVWRHPEMECVSNV